MRIMLNNYSYSGLVRALEDAGHEVLGKTAGPDEFNWWHHLINLGRSNEEYDAILRSQIEEHRPDVYLCGKGWHFSKMISPETTEWIRERVGCTLYWSLDDPDFMPTFSELEMWRGYDVALTCCGECVRQYEEMGLEAHLFWPAWDQEAREPVVEVPEDKRFADFLIVGTPYAHTVPARRDVAKAVSELGVDLWLYGPDSWVKQEHGGYSSLWKHYHGYWKEWGRVHDLFAGARVNFSNHVRRAEDYLNDRVPMVMGVGGVLFLDRQPGLYKWFVDGEEVVFFDDLKDLVSKLMYYLPRPDERARIGRAARQKMLSAHTYRHRAEQILDILAARGLK